MNIIEIIDLGAAEAARLETAAEILFAAFAPTGSLEWRTMDECRREVAECCVSGNLCLGALYDGKLAGWIGFRPRYGNYTWELHPLAVDPDRERRGVGRALTAEGERCLAARGVGGIILGSDDEAERTTLAAVNPETDDLFSAIRTIKKTSGGTLTSST